MLARVGGAKGASDGAVDLQPLKVTDASRQEIARDANWPSRAFEAPWGETKAERENPPALSGIRTVPTSGRTKTMRAVKVNAAVGP